MKICIFAMRNNENQCKYENTVIIIHNVDGAECD